MGSRQMLDKVSNGIALRSGISMVLFLAIMVTSVIPVMDQEIEILQTKNL